MKTGLEIANKIKMQHKLSTEIVVGNDCAFFPFHNRVVLPASVAYSDSDIARATAAHEICHAVELRRLYVRLYMFIGHTLTTYCLSCLLVVVAAVSESIAPVYALFAYLIAMRVWLYYIEARATELAKTHLVGEADPDNVNEHLDKCLNSYLRP